MRRLYPLSLILASTFLAVPMAEGLPNARVNDPALAPAAASDLMPAVGVLGHKILVVWYVRGTVVSERLHASYSEDGGATFQDAGWMPAAPTNWRWGVDPCIEVDPVTGTFMIAAQAANSTEFKQGIAFITAQVGGGIMWGAPSIVRETPYVGAYFIDQLHMKYDATYGSLELAFHEGFGTPQTLSHQVSWNRGVTWSPPNVLVTHTGGSMGISPRVGVSFYGPVVMYEDVAGWNQVTLRAARSVSTGTFDPPVTLASFRAEASGIPGAPADRFNGLSLAVDRTFSRFQNKIYAAWVASAAFPTPPVPSGTTLVESEPNDTPVQANAAGSGVGWFTADFSSPTDSDCIAVTLPEHRHLVVRASFLGTTGPNPSVAVEVIAPDGTRDLGRTDLPEASLGQAVAVFTAPRSATYTLRVTGFNVSSYQLSLAYADLTSSGLDRRDVYTCFSNDAGLSWSGPSLLYTSPAGFDVAGAQVVVGDDGRPYVFWMDFSQGHPDGALSSLRCARSSDGGSIWEAPRTISTAYSDWQSVPLTPGTYKVGPRLGAAATPLYLGEAVRSGSVSESRSPSRSESGPEPGAITGTPEERMCVVWPDARDGEGNLYAASFPTGFEVLYRTLDTVATPGQALALRMVLQNRNTFFPAMINPEQAACTRNWVSFQNPFFVDPGVTTSLYPVLVQVPDTAAAGTVLFQAGFNLGPTSFGLNTFIHVQAPAVGVVDAAASGPAFLEPSPNPAHAQAGFRYSVPVGAEVSLDVFDVSGARVRSLFSGHSEPGAHAYVWDLRDGSGRRVPAGVYLSRLRVGAWSRTRRLAVLR